jgi:Peptidase family M23/Putative serine esterase (DUF676)
MDRSWFRSGHVGAFASAGVALFVVATVVVPSATARADDSEPHQSVSWSLPVAGSVGREFEAPTSRYGAGHLGVDFVVPVGAPVRAAGDGVVTFAGSVAGALHVVVAHPGDLRTSYSYLATVSVRRGDSVARGDLLGTTGGPSGGHPPGFHLGLRHGDEYLDPMLLFRPTDLSRVVHLAPVGEAAAPRVEAWAVEALGVRNGLDLRERTVGGLLPGGTGGADDGTSVLDTIGAWLGDTAETGADLARRLPFAADAEAAAGRLAAAGRARLDCTAAPPDADGTGGSGHLLMAVGGINSSTDRATGATFDLPPDALGYRADEISWFSYADGGGPYDPADTHGRIEAAADRLADQLRELHRREPGREIDLVAHSQGGVVVDEFLQHRYDAADPTFPPIGTVVTLSSPHQGAPLATAADRIGATESGGAVLARAAGLGAPADAPVLADLREGSRTIRSLWQHRLPEQIDFTTIGAVDDVVVPPSQIAVPGATEVVVNPSGPLDHSAITDDDEALAAVRLALEGRPPPCPGLVSAVRAAVEPLVITRLEHAAGALAGAAGDLTDGILP